MNAFKRTLMIAAMYGGLVTITAPQANAGVIFRGGPVRRVAARTVLPPYPVARRAVVAPVYRPYARPYGAFYGGPGFYGPGVSVGVGVY